MPKSRPGQIRANQRRRAIRACVILKALYRSPRHGNKSDPLDELIFIILSQMTTHPSFCRVFDRVKEKVGTWDNITKMPLRVVKATIKDAGLSNQKAPRIRAIAARLKNDFGATTLDKLKLMDNASAEAYLTSLPGVGIKTAKCVMMYSLGRKVLPVDTHVRRVASRLGLLSTNTNSADMHRELESVVPATQRYGFHVNALSHGRAVCTAINPRCDECGLRKLCPSNQA